MSIPLWKIETSWFVQTQYEVGDNTFVYANWKDFLSCKPYTFWKPYILSSWSWKKVSEIPLSTRRPHYENPSPVEHDLYKLQLVFMTPNRFQNISRAEMFISEDDEPDVREWLKNHMPKLWKI